MTPQQYADAVVAQLTAAEFSLTPDSIERAYVVDRELGNSGKLELFVVPTLHTLELNDETGYLRETAVDVGISYKLNVRANEAIPNATIDPLSSFAIEVANYFASEVYEPPNDAEVAGVDTVPLFHDKQLTEARRFVSIMRVTFREVC